MLIQILAAIASFVAGLFRRRPRPPALPTSRDPKRVEWRNTKLKQVRSQADRDLEEGPTDYALDRMESRLRKRLPPTALALAISLAPAVTSGQTSTASRAWALAVQWEAEVGRQDVLLDQIKEDRDRLRIDLDQCIEDRPDEPPSRLQWFAIGGGTGVVVSAVIAVLLATYAPR